MQASSLKSTKTPNPQVQAGRKVLNAIRSLKDPEGSSIIEIKKFLNSGLHILNPVDLNAYIKDAINRGKLVKNGRKYKIVETEKKKTVDMSKERRKEQKGMSEDNRMATTLKKPKQVKTSNIGTKGDKKSVAKTSVPQSSMSKERRKKRKEKSEDNRMVTTSKKRKRVKTSNIGTDGDEISTTESSVPSTDSNMESAYLNANLQSSEITASNIDSTLPTSEVVSET